MKTRLFWVIIGPAIVLGLVLGSLTAFVWRPVPQRQSVCTMTDSSLNGPGAQENDAYCANGTNMAPSTYPEAIALAATKAIIVGTPTRVYTCHDFHRVLRVCVDFSRGFQAQHYLAHNPNYHPVWIYDPYSKQVWP